jgi:hypothetical protein
VTLALILTPSIFNIITDAKIARARTDCDTIGRAIVQFYRDTGFFPQWARAKDGGPGEAGDRLTLLVGPGATPTGDLINQGLQGWLVPVTQRSVGGLDEQLMRNGPGYTLRTASSEFGWNGPYLGSPVGNDPWNNRYMVNVGFFDPSAGLQTTTGAPKAAVWVISAGPNGQIETVFSQQVTLAIRGGDDIVRQIQ